MSVKFLSIAVAVSCILCRRLDLKLLYESTNDQRKLSLVDA